MRKLDINHETNIFPLAKPGDTYVKTDIKSKW